MRSAESIETERLILRAHRVEDFEDMHAMWSDPIVTQYIGGKPFSREDVWARLLRYAGNWAMLGYGYWAICERASGNFIGEAGFHNLHREIVPSFGDRPELGFALVPGAHGKGLATEAAQAALDWGDRTWDGGETVCMIAPENVPSGRIAYRLGYREMAATQYKGAPVVLWARRGTNSAPEH